MTELRGIWPLRQEYSIRKKTEEEQVMRMEENENNTLENSVFNYGLWNQRVPD